MQTTKQLWKNGPNFALQWRVCLGWTQARAAQELGLCTASLRLYEHGKARLPKTTRLAMEYLKEKSLLKNN